MEQIFEIAWNQKISLNPFWGFQMWRWISQNVLIQWSNCQNQFCEHLCHENLCLWKLMPLRHWLCRSKVVVKIKNAVDTAVEKLEEGHGFEHNMIKTLRNSPMSHHVYSICFYCILSMYLSWHLWINWHQHNTIAYAAMIL